MKNTHNPLAHVPKVVLAAHRQNRRELRRLLGEGADPNARMPDGRTALHLTAPGGGDTRTARILIEHGADPTLKDNKGQTAGDIAYTDGLYVGRRNYKYLKLVGHRLRRRRKPKARK